MKKERSMKRYYCSQVNEKNIDENIMLYGWVAKRRDHVVLYL